MPRRASENATPPARTFPEPGGEGLPALRRRLAGLELELDVVLALNGDKPLRSSVARLSVEGRDPVLESRHDAREGVTPVLVGLARRLNHDPSGQWSILPEFV